MGKSSIDRYRELMAVIRTRFDSIDFLSNSTDENFHISEIAAFHGRKIIEATAFGCLIALENGMKIIPKDAKGQYNAEKIFKKLEKKQINIFPSPSEIRKATEKERTEQDVTVTVIGIAERRITRNEIIKKYQRMHSWLHELNPYTKSNQEEFFKNNRTGLWQDLKEMHLFLKSHMISINGEAFYCTLTDKKDNLTKVIPLSKIEELQV